jgi:hypothetical protein
LNEAEAIDYKWLSPDNALNLYSLKQLPLFPPQILLLTYLTFLSRSYDHLKAEVAPKL